MHWEQFQLARESQKLEGKPDQGALLVLLILISHADKHTAVAFPGEDTLARETRLTDRGVRKILGNLVARGFISLVKKGVGRSNTDHYLCHVENGKTAFETEENRNPVPLLEEGKPEPRSSFIAENRNGEADKTGTVKQIEQAKTGTVKHAYKEEDKNKDIKSYIEENEQEVEIPVAVQSQSSRSVLAVHLPIAEAIAGVCGSRLKDLNSFQFQQMTKSLKMILSDPEGIELDELPTEIELRFQPPVFTLPNLPHLHQVGEWWHRQGVQKRRLDEARKLETPESEFAELYRSFS